YFDHRIEVDSPGLLLPGMTIEDMKAGVSKIRNPVIVRVFRELGLIEQSGSGVPRILSEARALGLPEPDIVEMASGVRFTVCLSGPGRNSSSELLDLESRSPGQPEVGALLGPSEGPVGAQSQSILRELLAD